MGQNYGQTDKRTDRRTYDPNTRCPKRTFQAWGIKIKSHDFAMNCEIWNQQKQANSENCGPRQQLWPWSRLRSRSQHGANWKGWSQGSCMPNISVLSLILQKIWARLKFLWQTDGLTDRRMSFNVPHFHEKQGTITSSWVCPKQNYYFYTSSEKVTEAV